LRPASAYLTIRACCRHDRDRESLRARKRSCRSARRAQEGRTAGLDRRPQQDTVHPRPVKVGDFTADGVNVADGLKPGDVVVAAGTQFMTENLKVKLSGDTAQLSASADSDGESTSSLR
jgi:hypothetical protein